MSSNPVCEGTTTDELEVPFQTALQRIYDFVDETHTPFVTDREKMILVAAAMEPTTDDTQNSERRLERIQPYLTGLTEDEQLLLRYVQFWGLNLQNPQPETIARSTFHVLRDQRYPGDLIILKPNSMDASSLNYPTLMITNGGQIVYGMTPMRKPTLEILHGAQIIYDKGIRPDNEQYYRSRSLMVPSGETIMNNRFYVQIPMNLYTEVSGSTPVGKAKYLPASHAGSPSSFTATYGLDHSNAPSVVTTPCRPDRKGECAHYQNRVPKVPFHMTADGVCYFMGTCQILATIPGQGGYDARNDPRMQCVYEFPSIEKYLEFLATSQF